MDSVPQNIVNKFIRLSSKPKLTLVIPRLAINANNIPINDSPAIKPDDDNMPFCNISS